MNQVLKDTQSVLYNDFVEKLREEYVYHFDENFVNHRCKMAHTALNFAEEVRNDFEVTDFVKANSKVKFAILHHYRGLKSETVDDLTETLRVVARFVHLKEDRSKSKDQFAKQYVEELLKRSNRKLVKVNNK